MRAFTTLALLFALIAPSTTDAREVFFSIDVNDMAISDVLQLIEAECGTNIIGDPSLKGITVTAHLSHVTYREFMSVLARAFDLQALNIGRVVLIGRAAAMYRKIGNADGEPAPSTIAISIHNGKVDDLAKMLAQHLPSETIITGDSRSGTLLVTGGRSSLRRARQLVAILDAGATGTVSAVIPLRFARSVDVAKMLKSSLPADGLVEDDMHNAIYVTGSTGAVSLARSMLQSIDTPAPQVMFEIKVADISSDAERRFGILFGGPGSNSVGTTSYAFQNKTIPIVATLDALVTEGDAQILAQPRLATLNNREASMLVGENYPIEQQTVSGGATSISVSFVDVGVKLRITPTIGADGSIIADLHPEFSAIAGTDSFGNPIVTNRKIDATLRVQRDETIVLGGLLREDDGSTITKLPFLGDLPILGQIFRNRQKSHSKDDVVFLITPHVL